jgi:hypothetical protein
MIKKQNYLTSKEETVFLKIEKVEIGKKKVRTKMDGTVLNNRPKVT